MSRILLASVILGLTAACSREDAAPPTAKAPPSPRAGPAAPAPEMAPAPHSRAPAASVPEPPKGPPRSFAPTPGLHLPAFTFRTMDGKAAMVQIGGEDLSTTPSLWSITPSFKAENLKLGDAWPPDGAKFVGKAEHAGPPASWAELYVIDRPERLARIAPLRKGECLLVVNGILDGKSIGG